MFTPKVWKGGTYSIQELRTLQNYVNPIDISSNTVKSNIDSLYTFDTSMLENLKSYISTTGFDIFGVKNEINIYSTQLVDSYSTILGLSSIINSELATLPDLEYQQQTAVADYQTKHTVYSSLQSTFNGLSDFYSTTVTEYIDALSTYNGMSTIMSPQIVSSYNTASTLMLISTNISSFESYAIDIGIPIYQLESTILQSQIQYQSNLISALQGYGTHETQSSIGQIQEEINVISSVARNLSTQIKVSTLQIQDINSTINGLYDIDAIYAISTARYDKYNASSLAQLAVLEAIYSQNIYIKNSTTTAYKRASTFIALNSTNILIQTVTNLIQQQQKGADVNSAVSALGLGTDLKIVYETLSTLASVEQAAYDVAMQGGARAEIDIAALYDEQIEANIIKYNEIINEQSKVIKVCNIEKEYYSTLYLSTPNAESIYSTNMGLYTSSYNGITSQITMKSNSVITLRNQITTVDSAYNSYNAYIESYTSSLVATQTTITDNMNTIANTALQIEDYLTVLENINSGNYLNLSSLGGPMKIMYQNAVAFESYSAELTGSLSTLYAYDYENTMGMLNVISTQLSVDTVEKRKSIANNNIALMRTVGPLSSDIANEISSVTTGQNTIYQFMPLFNQLYAYISSEYLNKIAYTAMRRTYEKQSYYKIIPPTTPSLVLRPDQFNKIQYVYDLLIQQINRIVDSKKLYVSTIFKPQLDYIVANVVEVAQRVYMNSPTSYQINNVEYLISSVLPLSVSYIYVSPRDDLFLSESLIPTTTRDVCLSTFDEVSTMNSINGVDVVLNDTGFILPTTTLDNRVCGVSGRYIQISKEDNDIEIMQIIVIDKTGKNVAFGKKSTILPAILQQIHTADLNYITNGNYSREAFMAMVESMNTRFYTRYMFVSPGVEGAGVPFSKLITIDLGETYDITAVHYLKFMGEYTSSGIKISIMDESRQVVATQSLTQNTEKEILDFTDGTQTSCPLDVKPLRYGTCGVLARYVRIYPPESMFTTTTVPTTTAPTTTVQTTTTLRTTTAVPTTTALPTTTAIQKTNMYITYYSLAGGSIRSGTQWNKNTVTFFNNLLNYFPDFNTTDRFENNKGYDIVLNFNMYWQSSNSAWGLKFEVYNSAGTLQNTFTTPTANPQSINKNITILNTQYLIISWSTITNTNGTKTDYPITILMAIDTAPPTTTVVTTTVPTTTVVPTTTALPTTNIIITYDSSAGGSIRSGTQWDKNTVTITNNNLLNLFSNFNTTSRFENNTGYDILLKFNMYWQSSNSTWALKFEVYNSTWTLQNTFTTPTANPQTINQNITILNNQYLIISWSTISNAGGTNTNAPITITMTIDSILPTTTVTTTTVPTTTLVPTTSINMTYTKANVSGISQIRSGVQWINTDLKINNSILNLFTDFNTSSRFKNNTGYDAILKFNMYWQSSNSPWTLEFKIYNSAGTLQNTITTPTANPQSINQNITILNTQYLTISWGNITSSTGTHTTTPITIIVTVESSPLLSFLMGTTTTLPTTTLPTTTLPNLPLYYAHTASYTKLPLGSTISNGEYIASDTIDIDAFLFKEISNSSSYTTRNFINNSGVDLDIRIGTSTSTTDIQKPWGLVFSVFNGSNQLLKTYSTAVGNPQNVIQNFILLNTQYFTIQWNIPSGSNIIYKSLSLPITAYVNSASTTTVPISATTTLATTTVPTTTVPPIQKNFIFSQIAVIDSNRENIAINKMVRLFTNGVASQVPASLVNNTLYQAVPMSKCYISPTVTTNTYLEIDLAAESDVTAVHIYNTSDTNNGQTGLRVKLYTEDRVLAIEANALTNDRKEVIPFIGYNVDSNCSTELKWPPYYGVAGLITRYVRLIQTQVGGFGFSKVEIVDKNGKDIGTFKPVTATSNQARAHLGVSNRQSALTADKCYVASIGPTLQSYIIDLQWEHEVCAVNIYGCSDVTNLTNNINIDLFRQLGTPLATRSLKGSQAVERFDFRTDAEDSVYPTTVTKQATSHGLFGTMCNTVIIPFSVLATDPAAAVVESTGKNLFIPKNISYNGGNTIVSLGYMADITSVTMRYDASKMADRLQLTDCNNNTVADSGLQILSAQIMYADFRNPAAATYAPVQPMPTRYGTKGTLAQYIRVIPRDTTTPLYVSQIIGVDSSGENVTIQATTFTPRLTTNTAYAVDGIYEANITDTDWLQMFYSKYRQKLASSSFVSVAGPQEQNYLLIDLGEVKELNSVIYVVSEGYNKTGEGVIVELIDSNLSVVGVQQVCKLATQFGLDILDFRLDRTESYLNPRASLEIIQRDPLLGKTTCGVLVKYIRIQQLSGSQAIQMSQVIAINSSGFNVALYKPTYSTSNNTASSTVVDGSYYMRTVEFGFISNATQGEYLEINLTEELEIVNVYVFNLLTDPTNNFANMSVVLYNAKRDIVMVQTMPASLAAGLSTAADTSNPAIKSFSNYPLVTKIGVSLQSNLMSIKSDIGLASAFANAGQTVPSIITANSVTGLECAKDLTSTPRFTRGAANGIPTRKIRIYNPGQYIQISQIMAFSADGTNVAMKKPCTATSVLPGFYVSRVTDGEGGYFHSARPESRSYVSGLKPYNYVEIDLETDYEIVGVKYIPPSSNYYRNVGMTIQLLSSDNVFLSQYLITANTAAGVLIDFRYPIGIPQTITQIIAPHIDTYSSGKINPIGIAEDSVGNIYYVDNYTGSITNMTSSSVVATGLNYPAGLACDGTSLYVADYGNNAVKKIGGGATTTLPLTGIVNPYGVYFNNGTLYCTEYKMAGRIFAYNIAAGTFQTFTQTFNYPSSIILNNANIFYVTSAYDRKVYTLTSPLVSSRAYIGTGLTIPITLSSPSSLTYDASSNIIFLADYAQNKIFSIGTITSVIAGTGRGGYTGDGAQAPFANLNKPVCIYYSRLKGYIFISDFQNSAIRYLDCYSGPPQQLQTTTTYPSYFTTTTLTKTDITVPTQPIVPTSNTITYSLLTNLSEIISVIGVGVTIDSFIFYNNIFYYTSNYKLYSYNLTTRVRATLGGSVTGYSGDGTTVYKFGEIKNLTINNNILYLCDYDYSVVRTINLATNVISTFMGSPTGSINDGWAPLNTLLRRPMGIAWDNNGRVYIIDAGNYVIRRISLTNKIETVVGTLGQAGSTQYAGNVQANGISLSNPTSIVFDKNNNLIVCDSGTSMIYIVNRELRMTVMCGGGSTPINKIVGSVSAETVQLNTPYSMSYDTLGNLYVTSYGTHQILKIVQDPLFSTYFVSVIAGVGLNTGGLNTTDTYSMYARLNNPTRIQAVAENTYYFLDYSNKIIRYVTPAIYTKYPIPSAGLLYYSPLLVLANLSGNSYNTSIGSFPAIIYTFTSTSMCSDFAGNVYICNGTNILKLDTNNTITTLVTGFTSLTGISIYNNSMLFVSDNSTIKSVTINGVITTIASNLPDVKINTIDLNSGCLFTMQPASKNIFVYNIKSGTTTPIVLTQTPYAIAADSRGNLFISTGDAIKKYVINYGATITLGTPTTFTSGLGMCRAIAYDKKLYYTSNTSYLIYSKGATDTDGATGQIISGIQNYRGVATNGTYSNTTTLYNPMCLTFDANGSMYILDMKPTSDSTIYKIPGYNVLTNEMAYNITGSSSSRTLTGNLLAPLAKYGNISGTCFGPDGSIYISDSLNNCIWKQSTEGIVTIYAGTGTAGSGGIGGNATAAQLSGPTGILMSSDEILYICDTGNNRVTTVLLVGATNIMTNFAGTGVAGTNTTTNTIATMVAIKEPTSITFDSYNNIYISCFNQIYRVNTLGIMNTYIGGGSNNPSQAAAPLSIKISPLQIAMNSSNELHFIDTYRNQLIKLATDGTIKIIAGIGSVSSGFSLDGTLATSAMLSNLQGLVIDSNNIIYIIDNGLVRTIRGTAIQTVAGNLSALAAAAAAAAAAGASSEAATTAYAATVAALADAAAAAADAAAAAAADAAAAIETLMSLSFYSPDLGPWGRNSLYSGLQWSGSNTTAILNNRGTTYLNFNSTTGYFYNTTVYDMKLNFNMSWNSILGAHWSLIFKVYYPTGTLQGTYTTSTSWSQTINQQLLLPPNGYFTVTWGTVATFRDGSYTIMDGSYTDVAIPVKITALDSPFLSFLLSRLTTTTLATTTLPTTTLPTTTLPTTTLNPAVIIPSMILNEVQNLNGLGQFPLKINLQKPGQLAIDNNGRLLVTQQNAPQLMLIPLIKTTSSGYVANTLTYGVPNIRYVKVRGNGTNLVTIEISQIAVIASSYLNVAKSVTANSNASTAANIIDRFYGSKSATYKSATSASEYVTVDLGENTDVVFVFLYLGLTNKTNNNGLLLDLLDSSNKIIQTRIIQNVTNVPYLQKISFDFRVSTMLSLNNIYENYKYGPTSSYSKKMVQFIRINTGGLPLLGLSQIVVKSADDGSNLAINATMMNVKDSTYYSKERAAVILKSLLSFTFNDLNEYYYENDINACVEINLGQPYNISNIIIYRPPLFYGQTLEYRYTITTYSLDGTIITYPTLPTPSVNTLTGPQYPLTTMKICDPILGIQNVRYIEYRNTPGVFPLQCSQLIVIDKYGINVAYGKKVIKGSSTIVNGVDNTQASYYTSATTTSDETVLIDLGSIYEVVFVKYWNAPTNLIYARGTTINLLDSNSSLLNSYLLTGTATSEFADFRTDGSLVGLTYAQSALTDSYLTGATMTRYIRVENPGYSMRISQIAIYDIFGVNLAVGCPTRSTLDNSYILVNNSITPEAAASLSTTSIPIEVNSTSTTDYWEIDLGIAYPITSINIYASGTSTQPINSFYKINSYSTSVTLVDNIYNNKNIIMLPVTLYDAKYSTIKNMYGITPGISIYQPPYDGLYDTVTPITTSVPTTGTSFRIGAIHLRTKYLSNTLSIYIGSTIKPFGLTSATGLFTNLTNGYFTNNSGIQLLILINIERIYPIGATTANMIITIYNSSAVQINEITLQFDSNSRNFSTNFLLLNTEYATIGFYATGLGVGVDLTNFKITAYKYNSTYGAYSYYLQQPTIANIISI